MKTLVTVLLISCGLFVFMNSAHAAPLVFPEAAQSMRITKISGDGCVTNNMGQVRCLKKSRKHAAAKKSGGSQNIGSGRSGSHRGTGRTVKSISPRDLPDPAFYHTKCYPDAFGREICHHKPQEVPPSDVDPRLIAISPASGDDDYGVPGTSGSGSPGYAPGYDGGGDLAGPCAEGMGGPCNAGYDDSVDDSPVWSGGHGGAVACTMEAKICPDGSAVGRTGPNCSFAPCPRGR